MTPPEGSQVHARFLGQEIDLKGKAAKNAPLTIALFALFIAAYAVWRMGTFDQKIESVDQKVDKIIFMLLERKR